MRNAVILLTGLGLLLLQWIIAWFVPYEHLTPILVLPVVLTMAVGEFSLARGALLTFVLGYLTDAGSGGALGLWTFTLVSVFLLARMVGLKLFLHGVVFQVLLTFLASIAAGVLMMGVLLVFDRRPVAVASALGVVAGQSLATAACAPFVFAFVAGLPGVSSPRPDEAA
ncbi:MAG: rod shape-determining protein MreD [Myxococcales bacterium]|nr:rod shape-determining protein MreD [Myxococcales bacterium]